MVERRPYLNFFSYLLLTLGTIIVCLPIYMAFVTSTHSVNDLLQAPIPILPGHLLWHNYSTVLLHGLAGTDNQPVWPYLLNSLVMALSIAIGKILVSFISAYAIVYFRFPLRNLFFWLIFITLMLPVEIRILPTFQVTAQLHMLNSYAGLSLPLIASATATFLFRQFYLTIPDELADAAKIDGAGAFRFLIDILLPLSKTNIAALFIVMFIYGWNQYLWPLIITTQSKMDTIVMSMQELASVVDQVPQWNYVMAVAILALLLPVVVVIAMQRLFVKGLIETEK